MKIDYMDYKTLLEQIDLDDRYFVVDGDYIYNDEEVYLEEMLEQYTGIKDNLCEWNENLMEETEEYTGRELLLKMFKDLEEHKEYYQTKYRETLKEEVKMNWRKTTCVECDYEIGKHEEYYATPDGVVCIGCIDDYVGEYMENLTFEWKRCNEPDYDFIMDDMRSQEENQKF